MPRPVYHATRGEVAILRIAQRQLRTVRMLLREANAPQTLRKVQGALKTLDGAVRHKEEAIARRERAISQSRT